MARSWNRPLRPSSPSAVPRGARTVPPDAEKLTWDFLRGLPRPVGAAPAMGDEGRRTAVQEKGASSSSACHTPSSPRCASLPRPVSSLLTAHPGQARWTPSPQSHVGSTRRGTDLTGALWGFPFTLAAMFGKHPEPRGGKVLKEREKRSQSLRPRPQAPAKISVPSVGSPGERWRDQKTLSLWEGSHPSEPQTGERERRVLPAPGTVGFRRHSREAAGKEALLGGSVGERGGVLPKRLTLDEVQQEAG